MAASSMPRRPRRPPWIFGCRVLTRPSIISGKPVYSATSITVSAASRSSRAVPPVERISTPRAASARASSATPLLSDTEISARRTGCSMKRRSPRLVQGGVAVGSAGDAVQPQLLAQGAAVDAENISGPHLVAFGVVEHCLQQRLLDFTQHQVVQMRGAMAIQTREV